MRKEQKQKPIYLRRYDPGECPWSQSRGNVEVSHDGRDPIIGKVQFYFEEQ